MTKNLQDFRAEARAEMNERFHEVSESDAVWLDTLIDSVLDRVEDCVPQSGLTKAPEWYTEMATLLKRNAATSLIPEKARHFVLTQVLMEAQNSTCEEFLTNLSTLRS